MSIKVILNSLYYSGLQALSKPYFEGAGSIVMLHRVQNIKRQKFEPTRALSVSPQFLDEMIFDLKRKNYDFISMDEVAERLANPQKYKDRNRFISITLDDAYRDNLENAIPVFQRHNVPYMIYVAPGLSESKASLLWEDLENVINSKKKITIDMPQGREEHDVDTTKKKYAVYNDLLDRLLMNSDQSASHAVINQLSKAYGYDQFKHVKSNVMNWDELKSLLKDPLCSLGAHSIHHYAIAKLSLEDARYEMEESRAAIKRNLGYDAMHFAYPFGMEQVAGEREFKLAKELGFLTATTTRHGVLYDEHKDHLSGLPRVSLNGNFQAMRYVDTLLSGFPTRLKNKGRKLNVS